MLEYNTQNRRLSLSEYGRNVQQMVDFCLTIEDREERTRCAYAIIEIIKNISPEYKKQENGINKLWDHLNIMSNFQLDIDFPVEVITPDILNIKADRIPYRTSPIRYRHYGKNIELMIDKVANMPDGEEKDILISMIAHHMKKLMLIHNKEGVDDAKILRDLAEYSNGLINLDPQTYLLHEFKEAPVAEQKKSKKKRK